MNINDITIPEYLIFKTELCSFYDYITDDEIDKCKRFKELSADEKKSFISTIGYNAEQEMLANLKRNEDEVRRISRKYIARNLSLTEKKIFNDYDRKEVIRNATIVKTLYNLLKTEREYSYYLLQELALFRQELYIMGGARHDFKYTIDNLYQDCKELINLFYHPKFKKRSV